MTISVLVGLASFIAIAFMTGMFYLASAWHSFFIDKDVSSGLFNLVVSLVATGCSIIVSIILITKIIKMVVS